MVKVIPFYQSMVTQIHTPMQHEAHLFRTEDKRPMQTLHFTQSCL